ncbi:MAG: phosphotransferase family protein [Alphaproteobacteria bacterium]|nr:phosphotransferase family protein [Alphaproteobacteria bacterium]
MPQPIDRLLLPDAVAAEGGDAIARADSVGALRPAGREAAQDWSRVAAFAATQGLRLDLSVTPRQFAGGFGNLNYLLRLAEGWAVLRRPPGGPIPAGGNDMAREHKVLSRLWRAYPLAPRGLAYCADPAVIGAPFQINEHRAGIAVRDSVPDAIVAAAGSAAAAGARLGGVLVPLAAALHGVDPAQVGLADLGRPTGFLRRTAEGWAKRCAAAWDGNPPPLLDEIIAWLLARTPPDGAACLIHNDFKLDNLLIDPATLAPTAVLDWDMATLGDPLYDLAVTLSYWTEAGDPPVMHALRQMPTAGPGFPRRADALQAYARATGRDLAGFAFHRALALVRLAGVFKQLHRRWSSGGSDEARLAGFGAVAEGLLEMAHAVTMGRAD